MLGSPQRTVDYCVDLTLLFDNFLSSLNNEQKQLLPKSSKVVNAVEDYIEYFHRCWLLPELCEQVVKSCILIIKVLVYKNVKNVPIPQYMFALGTALPYANIHLYCYKYLADHFHLISDIKRDSDVALLLQGLSRIIENVPQCGSLVSITYLASLTESSNINIKRLAEHVLAQCTGLHDDVFNANEIALVRKIPNTLVDIQVEHEITSDKCLTQLNYPLFTTGRNVIHAKQSKCVTKPIIYTENISRVIDELGKRLELCNPVILEGEIGTGKTLVLEHFASLFGIQGEDLLSVQIDEQTDSKVLIGSYVCGDVPGQYVWQPGILTRAVKQGKWIIFEDIDHAPSDIISLIKSLSETKSLRTPTSIIRSHPNFTMFLTQRVNEAGYVYKFNTAVSMLDNTFTKIHLPMYTDPQLVQVISGKFPSLGGCATRLIELYRSLDSRVRHVRQLVKWCYRIQEHLTHNLTVVTKEVFLEAIDCFCSGEPCPQKRLETARAIGTFLSMANNKIETFLETYKPSVVLSATHFTLGRATLPCLKQDTRGALFAYTRHTLLLLEKLGCAVLHNEPVLLTGETGTGKTATVQHLANRTGNKLVVINMSQQTDTSDLIGGFKPLDVIHLIKPLYERFELLFKESYSVSKNANFLQKAQICWRNKDWNTLLQAILHIATRGSNTKHSGSWETLRQETDRILQQIDQIENSFAFAFVEGSLVKAVKRGDWVLLDEINLAPPELLESLNCILEDTGFTIVESGEMDVVRRHENFRLFACMNPSTDVGKKDLPVGIKNRFTEIYVDELRDENDLKILTAEYLHTFNLPSVIISKIVGLYLSLLKMATDVLVDGRGHKPCYSLRTLCRALKYAGGNPCGHVLRSLYEGFCLSFLTQLDRSSYPLVRKQIISHLLPDTTAKDIIKHKLPKPELNYIQVEGYWLEAGEETPYQDKKYVITPSVKENLADLARAVSFGECPVLLQGPTSAGKTSVVKYLAQLSGTKIIRINNHEHTDLQEYLGSYCVGEKDKLVFKEGLLVDAMRHGYWLILDELNLAPTDVLEALNRVLDDNRELFIPETQTTVRAHPHFMLFATQNPAGSYGGRKMLSRAFRNRFIEFHYEDLPLKEIQTILEQRSELPPSYSLKIVKVMQHLQSHRCKSGIFAGRHALITLRDLFRWAGRYRYSSVVSGADNYHDWDQQLANDGYMLLSGRIRQERESETIKSVIEKVFKRQINVDKLYDGSAATVDYKHVPGFDKIVWTKSMSRLLTLVSTSLLYKEPVLLVGETGCGKTTICQVLSVIMKSKLHILNCHMHSETADFIGSLRPVREAVTDKLFEWVDGPLVQAVKEGNMILLDEISLADDSVLERLNSVLESERQLTIAESSNSHTITAHEQFRIIATMNPGGDYGKKELSPALRNRFTEIWCKGGNECEELFAITRHNLIGSEEEKTHVANIMMEFIQWFRDIDTNKKHIITVRDILTWVDYINKTKDCQSTFLQKYMHGAYLVIIDGLGETAENLKQKCYEYLKEQCKTDLHTSFKIIPQDGTVSFGPLSFKKGLVPSQVKLYSLEAPTTASNVFRIIRGLQVDKPILLEGHPGVGKTSVTTALAKLLGFTLTRINLSEQTDLSDLFGCDLPNDNGAGFSWRDGPLLQALKQGHWVLLDEMNLASQAVLEGLNACLDHRGEVFIPELSKTFKVSSGDLQTRFIACMNPVNQGGGRKGLPKSFMNRFIKVYIDMLSPEDMMIISQTSHPNIPTYLLQNMIIFNQTIYKQVCEERTWGQSGAPWEFNLRDVRRWCELVTKYPAVSPAHFVSTIYIAKFRNQRDKAKVVELRDSMFKPEDRLTQLRLSDTKVHIGATSLPRSVSNNTTVNNQIRVCSDQLQVLDLLAQTVNLGWMSILVGPSDTGKSTVVRLLADLCGRELVEIACSSVFDTSDLLGGFSQVSLQSYFESIKDLVKNCCKLLISHEADSEILVLAEGVLTADTDTDVIRLTMTFCKRVVDSGYGYLASSLSRMSSVMKKIENYTSGLFEWKNSVFVDALIEGNWVVLDNANLISPSVLDRLNPLLEQGGVITLDERGYVDGNPLIINPHPNFRIFMTMNPKYGELSRPMRNRGIEINMERVYDAKLTNNPTIVPQNSTVFMYNLYGHILRRHSSTNNSKTSNGEVCRAVLSYMPPYLWKYVVQTDSSIFSPSLTLHLHKYLTETEECWTNFDKMVSPDVQHVIGKVISDTSSEGTVNEWFARFVTSSFSTTATTNILSDIGIDIRTRSWESLFAFRKCWIFYERFCKKELGTLWWELRNVVQNTTLKMILDERHGKECDDEHWKFVKQLGHPPLTHTDETGLVIDSYLEENSPINTSDDAMLNVLFPANLPSETATQTYLGVPDLVYFLVPALLNPSHTLSEEDYKLITETISPHLTPFLQYALQTFTENHNFLPDVLAGLLVKVNPVKDPLNFHIHHEEEITKCQQYPTLQNYTSWVEHANQLTSNLLFASLLQGSPALRASETNVLQLTLKTMFNLDTASNREDCLDKLIQMLEVGCKLSTQDPVQHYTILAQCAREFIKLLSEMHEIYSTIQCHSHGTADPIETVYPLNCINQLLHVQQLELKEMDDNCGYRPSNRTYTGLREEVTSYFTTLGSEAKLRMLVDSAGSSSEGSSGQYFTSWVKSTATFVERVYQWYWHYRDQLSPIVIALYCLIQELSNRHRNRNENVNCFQLFNNTSQLIEQLTKSIQGGKMDKDKKMKALQTLTSLCRYENMVADNLATKSSLRVYLLTVFYLTWQANEELKTSIERSKESIYKDTERFQNPEVSDMELLSEMFPSYSAEFEDLEDPDKTRVITQDTPAETKDTVLDMTEDISSLIDMFAQLDSDNTEDAQHKLTHSLSLYSDLSARTSASMIVARFSVQLEHLKKPPQIENTDIYRGENPMAVLEIRQILLDLEGRVGELLETWPENPALTQIKEVVDRICTFSISEPIIKFLQGLEILLGRCQLWESIASRDVSIQVHLTAITQQIITWRALELRMWPTLLDTVKSRYQRKGGDNFLKIAHLVTSTNKFESYEDTKIFISTLMSFIEDSTLGDYSSKLNYLKLCYEKLATFISKETAQILRMVHVYYSQLQGHVQKSLEEQTFEVKKELKEYTKIMKWKDVNYFSVKLATEQSHQKLLKFMKRYEECLTQPLSSLTASYPVLNHPIQSVGQTSSGTIASLRDLNDLITETVQGFRDNTIPAIEDKEKRLKAYKSLDLRKRKAVSELFKCLSFCGLSYTRGKSLYFSVDYFYSILTSAPPGPETAWLLYNLNTLLNLTTSPSDELGPVELDRIRGYSGHLFSVMIDMLTIRSKLESAGSRIRNLRDNIKEKEELCSEQMTLRSKIPRILVQISQLCDCTHQLNYLRLSCESVGKGDTTFGKLMSNVQLFDPDCMELIHGNVDYLKHSITELKKMSKSCYLISKQDKELVLDCEKRIPETVTLLEDLANKQHTIGSAIKCHNFGMLQGLLDYAQQIRSCFPGEITSIADQTTSSVKDINAKLSEFGWHKGGTSRETEQTQVNKNWGVNENIILSELDRIQSSYNGSDITKRTDMLVDIVGGISHLVDKKANIGKVLQRLKKTLDDVIERCEEDLAEINELIHGALLPFISTILNLFRDLIKRGYCKPAELEEAEKEGGEMFDNSEGGGVGEGEGAKDVSDQITDESQVEGTRQEDKEEQDPVKEEENGLNMEDDFEGNLENMEKGGDDENDDNSDNEDEENREDEQMGDVDDAEEKQKAETFGENDEKLPENEEKEADTGDQSEKQDELTAKDSELNEDQGEKGEEDQEVEQEMSDREEDDQGYNSEDDVPDPDAPGQMMDTADEDQVNEMPEDLENLDGDENGEEQQQDMDENAEDGSEEEDNSADNEENKEETAQEEEEIPDRPEDDEMKSEDVSASLASHHSQANTEPQQTESTTAEQGDDGENGDEGDQHGASADTTGETSTSKTEDPAEPDAEHRKRQRQNEQQEQQRSQNQTAKRLKTLPNSSTDVDPNKAEITEKDVFEHTKEGEEFDKETVDKSDKTGEEGMIEEDEKEESEKIMEDYTEDEPEDQDKKEDMSCKKKTQDKNGDREDMQEDEKMELENEAPDKEQMDIEDTRQSYHHQTVPVSSEHIPQIRKSIMEMRLANNKMSSEEAKMCWDRYESLTTRHSQELCEQLRLILEPTKAAKLRGDYRTGKRLNMKKIIPYIASKFQKDKIWLRRTKPSDRDYQVMIALDDSASMSNAECVQMSMEAVAVICGALSKLDVGQIGVCGFGGDTSLVIPFTEPFTSSSGAKIVQHFSFEDESTDIIRLLDSTCAHFSYTAGLQSSRPLSQLLFIISDGRGLFVKGVESVKKAVKESWSAGVFTVFLIIDKQNKKDSILDIRTPVFDENGKLLRIESYLDTFPFHYYLVLRSPDELPNTLSDALRQWIEIVS